MRGNTELIRGNTELIWASVALVAAILLGIVILFCIKRWRNQASVRALAPGEELAHYSTMVQQGLLSAEEFERIRQRMLARSPATSASPAPPAPAPDQQVTPPTV